MTSPSNASPPRVRVAWTETARRSQLIQLIRSNPVTAGDEDRVHVVADDRLEVAELAAVCQLPDDLVAGGPPAVRAQVEGDAVPLHGLRHRLGFRERRRQRLLRVDGLDARVGRVDRDLRALLLLGPDADDVGLLFVDHLAEVGVEGIGRHTVVVPDSLQRIGLEVRGRDELRALARDERLGVREGIDYSIGTAT